MGSDHQPIVFRFQSQAIKIMIREKLNLDKLDINKYKTTLSSIEFESLNGKKVIEIDNQIEKINKSIQLASKECCPTIKVGTSRNYIPTLEIQTKLKQYQYFSQQHFYHGYNFGPTLHLLSNELKTLVFNHKTSNWNKLIELANEYYGKPSEFWRHYKIMKGDEDLSINHSNIILKPDEKLVRDANITNINTTSQSSADQAAIMSFCWQTIFKTNKGKEFNNDNTKKVYRWFQRIKNNLKEEQIIDFRILPLDHFLRRPINVQEFLEAIKCIKLNKAPGPTNIRGKQLYFLPPNFNYALVDIYNAILASNHYPLLLKTSMMVFINKPNKINSNPLNYRPISLLDIMGKIFESINS